MSGTKWLQRSRTVAIGVPVTLLVLNHEWSTAILVHVLHYLALMEFSVAVPEILPQGFPTRSQSPLNIASMMPTLFVSLGMMVGATAHWGPYAVGK